MAGRRVTGRLEWIVAVVGSILFLTAILYFLYNPRTGGMRADETVGELARKARLVDDLRLLLARSSQDERTSILADDDERTIVYADAARKDMEDLEKSKAELDALVKKGRDGQEIKLAKEFDQNWKELREISDKLLALSMVNSSVKAFEVSKTKAAPALDAYLADLDRFMNLDGGRSVQAVRLAGQAQVAALKIMALHGPHIDEEDDKAMDAMEQTIRDQAAAAKNSLSALAAQAGRAAPPGQAEAVAKAQSDFQAFMEATDEVLRLSRLNSRYKAMALTFGAKRRAESLCDDTLAALKLHIQNRTYKATR